METKKQKECVSVKTFPLIPLFLTKNNMTRCLIHPNRLNCLLDVSENNNVYFKHYTLLNNNNHEFYLNAYCKPYYEVLLTKSQEMYYDYVLAPNKLIGITAVTVEENNEEFYSIDKGSEREVVVLKNIILHLRNYLLPRDTDGDIIINEYTLLPKNLCIDLIYSEKRVFILPQKMYVLPATFDNQTVSYIPTVNSIVNNTSNRRRHRINDNELFAKYDIDEPLSKKLRFSENVEAANNNVVTVVQIPVTQISYDCQLIYRTFLIYNTILTCMLQKPNPFNDPIKKISEIIRDLGTCPENRGLIKLCDLDYGGNSPGHLMCIPKGIVIKIYHYAKWSYKPNNYKLYYESILKLSPRQNRLKVNNYNRRLNLVHHLMLWESFLHKFNQYFFG